LKRGEPEKEMDERAPWAGSLSLVLRTRLVKGADAEERSH
jgi:hypothetical protein